ncbi:hydroxyacylglutathione hydrolase [Micractinium conductrix]|uniref:hydroxyacylglutathione hydrolase n=1 Tax=Micractinium conductrix TaxID=554055 RepID=A0A2P6VPR9_9CHLO|nr:hydroxyacylglutathione hydrolase [Micractinium conductrix]|eukprot:PSC76082.1 hydroxyacylglutathione hydrolase [Micractinium conductrix]
MAAGNQPAGVLQIERVPCLSDNYSWLLHEPSAGVTAVVDPAEVAPVVAAAERLGWTLTHILNTHHHWDHVGGNEELKKRFGVTIVGPAADAARIPGIDVQLKDGDRYSLGAAELQCFDTPGHTRGHVTFHFPASKALFPGDTLFSLGCGRLFEGTPAQMWASLSKFAPLPGDTRVYCAHEYTESNARFAVHVDAGNEDLKRMHADITAKRARQEPTVPSVLDDERKCNPFLRPDSPAIRAALGVPADASNDVAFGAIRAAKDTFR